MLYKSNNKRTEAAEASKKKKTAEPRNWTRKIHKQAQLHIQIHLLREQRRRLQRRLRRKENKNCPQPKSSRNHQHQHRGKWQTLRYISAAVDWRRPQNFLNARTPLPNTFAVNSENPEKQKIRKNCFSSRRLNFLQLLRFFRFYCWFSVCICISFFFLSRLQILLNNYFSSQWLAAAATKVLRPFWVKVTTTSQRAPRRGNETYKWNVIMLKNLNTLQGRNSNYQLSQLRTGRMQ